MDLKLLLCFIMISPIFGDILYPQNPQELMELDRARSAWNFGGHHAARINKKVALNQWGRQRSSVPASAITNRRQGTLPKITGSTKKKSIRSSSPGSQMQPRQYKSYPKPVKPGKRTKVNRNVQSPTSPSMPMAPPAAAPQTYFPHPFYNQQQQPKPMWNRGSRMINSRSDTILNKFRKEDLWHLDKGEGYPLKNEDLEYDDFQRNYRKLSQEANSIDDQHQGEDHHNQIEEDQHAHPQHELEQQAEKLINNSEDVICNKNHQTGEENALNHIHHHHHYNDGKEESHHEQKKPDHKKLTIPPLPRIHNPIPLGCLLTVPVFHPIRPRSHVACLLSIPGTPNLMKRRRRRSTDSQQQQQQQQQQQLQSQSQIFQMFNGNQRMSPVVTRKRYSNHIGNGKTPLSQSQSMNTNLKVPATIIAPPAFDKADLLSMLMGSGGVNPNEMGTILATNSRYVRFGRGLPNSDGTRKGRNLQWFPDNSKNQYHSSKHPSASSMASISSQQPSSSSSNHMPTMVKLSGPPSPPSSMLNQNQYSTPSLPQNQQVSSILPPSPPQYKNSLIPQPKQHQPSHTATPPLPLVLNVHIALAGSRPSHSRGPVINVSVPNSQQAPIPSSSHSYQHVAPSPTVKPKKYGESFKYSEYWKPVSAHKESKKTQKPFKYNYYKPEYNNDIFSSSESKLSYSKVKPEVATESEQLVENEGYQNLISYNDENIEAVPSVEYYDNAIQNTDDEYVGESSPRDNEDTFGYDHFSSKGGQDHKTENKVSNNIKTYSFAVKNNNDLKTGFDFDISSDYNEDTFSASSESSRDKSYFDNPISAGAGTDSNDLRMAETVSNRNQNFDNNYYYSLVRQLAGHSLEPIIINVPKDGPMSNEIKK